MTALEDAIANSRIIHFSEGAYDISGWRMAPLSNIRLVGSGKGRTVLFSDTPYGGPWSDTSSRNNFGLIKGKIEVENLTFENLKTVFFLHVAGASNASHTPEIYATCAAADALGNTPSNFHAGVTIKNCSFIQCRRPIFGTNKNDETETTGHFWLYDCDLIRCWIAGMSIATGRVHDIYMYNCFVRDTVVERDLFAKNSASQSVLTCEWGYNTTAGHEGWDAVNLRIENCTFYGSAYIGPVRVRYIGDNIRIDWPRAGIVRMMAVGSGCWVKNSRFIDIGRLTDGRLTSAPRNAYPIYYKGNQLLIENCVFEGNCGKCVISAKGHEDEPLKFPSGPVIRNALFKDNREIVDTPAFFDEDGPINHSVDLKKLQMIGVIGQNRLGDTRLENVLFKNMTTQNGLIYAYKVPGEGGATGRWSVRRVTIENFVVTESKCFLYFEDNLEELTVENTVALGLEMTGEDQAFICLNDQAAAATVFIGGDFVFSGSRQNQRSRFAIIRNTSVERSAVDILDAGVHGADVTMGVQDVDGHPMVSLSGSPRFRSLAESESWMRFVGCATRD